MKCVSYMRCSGLGQTSGDTWERQSETIQGYCSANGYKVAEEFREEAVPGKYDEEKRPAFQDMVTSLLSNGCRTVVVERLDRLARAYRMQEHLITYLASKEIAVISADTGENVTEAMMGDPMRRALVQIQGIFSELEKNMLVAKLKKARTRLRAKGIRVEGVRPYGEHPDYPAEKELVSRIHSLRSEGYSYEKIADLLNAEGVKPRTGKKWFKMTIKRILGRAVAPHEPS